MKFKSWLLYLLIVLHTTVVLGQSMELKWVHIPEISRTIPNIGITCFVQDRQGFMWFGTEDGLNRFDGMQFRSFQYTPFLNSSIAPGKITALICDGKGLLWAATDLSGAFSFDPVTEQTHFYHHDADQLNSIAENSIVKMMEDQNGNVWFAHRFGGISCLNTITQKFTIHKAIPNEPDSLHAQNITDLFQSKDGLVWIGTGSDGLECFDPKQRRFIHYPSAKILNNSKPLRVNSLVEDGSGHIWFSANDAICQFDRHQNQFTIFSSADNKERASVFFNSSVYRDGSLFFCSDNGLWWIDPLSHHIKLLHFDLPLDTWTNRVAWYIYGDKDDHLWVCFGGAIYMSTGHAPLPQLMEGNNIPNVESLIPTGHMLNREYRVTEKGVAVHLFCTGEETIYPVPPDQISQLRQMGSHAFWCNSHASTFGIHAAENGIWIYNHQAHRFDELPDLPCTKAPFDNSNLTNSYVDSHHTFWAGTLDGKILRYTRAAGWYQLTRENTNNAVDTNARVIMFLEDKRGVLWIMDYQLGIIKYDFNTGTFKKYPHINSDPFSTSVFYPYSIYEDRKGQLWFGGQGRALDLYDPEQDRFVHFKKDQAFDKFILRILEDKDGSLWSFNEESITHFIPPDTIDYTKPFQSQFDYVVYSDRKGWDGYNNAFHYGYTDCTGHFYYSNEYGLFHFNSDQLKDTGHANPIFITQLQINGHEILPGSGILSSAIQETDSLHLQHNQNTLSLSFAYLDYWHPERHQYKYKMEGLDSNFLYVGADNRTVNYSNLSPGHYVFTVKAETGNDDWDQHVQHLAITIVPAFWQTAAFKFLVIGSLLGLLVIGFRWRVKNIKTITAEKNKVQDLQLEQYRVELELEKIKQQLTEAQLAALRAQMNPHFIFNSLQSINRYIVRSEPDLASHYLTKFSKLIRLILDHSRATFIPLDKELEALQLYVDMELLRFENKFDCQVDIDKNIEASEIEVPPMIFQPFVENAIWHGVMHKKEKGHIRISFRKIEEMLECTIEDDGVGRQRAVELESKSAVKVKSLGMALTENRLKLINGHHSIHPKVEIEDLVDSIGNAGGTRVTILLPFNYV